MKRFLIKKIIVISNNEEASFETEFDKGLNILIGKNKTGKSSIIKSIFYTLGCETYVEDSWKKIIDTYILYFKYGEDCYCLVRENSIYKFYKFYENKNSYEYIIKANDYEEYTKYLVKNIFNIEAELLTKKGKISTFIPPLLFRFQYIDQDSGWIKLGESFLNAKYIEDWKNCSIKFIIGYQGEEYYRLKKKVSLAKNEISELKVKEKHYNEIYDTISKSIISSNNISNESIELEELKKEVNCILEKKSLKEREQLLVNDSISHINNEIYELTLTIKLLEKSIMCLDEDYSFAMEEDEEIKCPTCGMVYDNTIINRIDLVKDMQSGRELISSYRSEMKNLQGQLDEEIKKKKTIKRAINNLNILLKDVSSKINISEIYKEDGRREVIGTSKKQIKDLISLISEKEIEKSGYDKEIKKLESPKRRNVIKKEFEKVYEEVLSKVNINSNYINLRNFVQKIDNTGSERPRTILSYHIALYLYNLSKGENLYNWLVIDTPNQQGQDDENLKNIDSLISSILSENGQVIIGTERETGFENKANKIIKLTKHKQCLNYENYKEHCILVDYLESLIPVEIEDKSE